MVARSVASADRRVLRVHELARRSIWPCMRPRLTVLAPSVVEVVRSAGGWLFDRAMAGWDVTVITSDHSDSRPLRILGASVRDNLVLGELARFTRLGLVDPGALEREARKRLEGARIVPLELDLTAAALSGGNQQKLVVARAVGRSDRVSVFDYEPQIIESNAET